MDAEVASSVTCISRDTAGPRIPRSCPSCRRRMRSPSRREASTRPIFQSASLYVSRSVTKSMTALFVHRMVVSPMPSIIAGGEPVAARFAAARGPRRWYRAPGGVQELVIPRRGVGRELVRAHVVEQLALGRVHLA